MKKMSSGDVVQHVSSICRKVKSELGFKLESSIARHLVWFRLFGLKIASINMRLQKSLTLSCVDV